jgi:hypothetical protein
MYLDLALIREILMISCTILKDNFFFDDDALVKFLNQFQLKVVDEYIRFEETCDEQFKDELENDFLLQGYFTSYFTSLQLQRVMINDFHFEEIELRLFENILPKYIGEKRHDTKPSDQRTDYRELFKGL